jgi:hypothetical protein
MWRRFISYALKEVSSPVVTPSAVNGSMLPVWMSPDVDKECVREWERTGVEEREREVDGIDPPWSERAREGAIEEKEIPGSKEL